MSYIGTPPSNAFTSLLKQDFSTSATTGYTLDHAVNNANDIALFINFVRQEPTAAYSASGTTLTLTSATASSDDMYCVYLGQALQTVNPANASVGSSQLSPTAITGQTALTSVASDDTVLISDTSASGALKKMTRANFVSGIGGANSPFFKATTNTVTTLANTTWTKVILNVAEYDTSSTYNTSSYRFTPGVAGYYSLSAAIHLPISNDFDEFIIGIRKNGAEMDNIANSFFNAESLMITTIDLADDNDYYEVFAYHNKGGGENSTNNPNYTWFSGYKLIT